MRTICGRFPMSARRSPRSVCPNAWPRAARRRRFAMGSPAPGFTICSRRNIFSATQVKRGKPAPDLFLFAAEQMQASPARCLVIEDSVPGITGARRRRDDRARLSRRQPLPARLRRHAARRRRRRDVRRYAAIARSDRRIEVDASVTGAPSFRDGAQNQTRNLGIPGSMLAHRPGMTLSTLDFRPLAYI